MPLTQKPVFLRKGIVSRRIHFDFDFVAGLYLERLRFARMD